MVLSKLRLPAKVDETEARARLVLAKRKRIPRNKRKGRHCVLVKYAGADEVAVERTTEVRSSTSTGRHSPYQLSIPT